MKKFIALMAMLLVFTIPAKADEREDILEVINQFFKAQKDRDADLWQEIMLPDGVIMSHREREGAPWVLTTRTAAGDLERLGTGDVVIDEIIYDPAVLVHKTIATVWAPYVIYVGDRLLHCGIDNFHLFKVDGKWKISHFAYTTEPEGCEGLGLPPKQ